MLSEKGVLGFPGPENLTQKPLEFCGHGVMSVGREALEMQVLRSKELSSHLRLLNLFLNPPSGNAQLRNLSALNKMEGTPRSPFNPNLSCSRSEQGV